MRWRSRAGKRYEWDRSLWARLILLDMTSLCWGVCLLECLETVQRFDQIFWERVRFATMRWAENLVEFWMVCSLWQRYVTWVHRGEIFLRRNAYHPILDCSEKTCNVIQSILVVLNVGGKGGLSRSTMTTFWRNKTWRWCGTFIVLRVQW